MKISIKIISVILFVVIAITNINAQLPELNWAYGIGTGGTGVFDGVRAVTTDNAGNVYVAGEYGDSIDFDPGLSTYKLPFQFQGEGMTSDGFVAKYAGDGALIWVKRIDFTAGFGYEASLISAIEVDPLGNVYTTGYFWNNADFDPGFAVYPLSTGSTGGIAVFVSKLDSNGDFVWAKQFKHTPAEYNLSDKTRGKDLAIGQDGSVYVLGSFSSTLDMDPGLGTVVLNSPAANGSSDFLTKLDASGDFVWTKPVYGESLALGSDDIIYIAGSFSSTVNFDPNGGNTSLTSYGQSDIFITKLDLLGNLLEVNHFGGAGIELATELEVDNAGNQIIGGTISGTSIFDQPNALHEITSFGATDILLCKVNAQDSILWVRNMGGLKSENTNSIAIDFSGNIYSTGQLMGDGDFDPGIDNYQLTFVGPYEDAYISKLDSSGNFLWAKLLGGVNRDTGYGVDVNSLGSVFLVGTHGGGINFDAPQTYTIGYGQAWDGFIAKYDQCRSQSTQTITACSYTAPDGQVYTTPGTYTAIIPNAMSCDSIITINLTINNPSTSSITETVCSTYTAPDGTIYSTSGTFTAVVPNAAGCDSTITINLTVNNPSTSSITETVCSTYTAPDGTIYSTSGTFTAVVPNASGCDSTITINLMVNNPSTSSITETTCGSYTAPDGQVYSTSGTYTAIVPNAVGCDSIITVNLNLSELEIDIPFQSFPYVVAIPAADSYRWYDCNTGELISTDSTSNITENWEYLMVIVDYGTCSDTISCDYYNQESIEEYQKDNVKLYPNPTGGLFHLDLGQIYSNVTLKITDLQGREIKREEYSDKQLLEMSLNEANGVYLVHLIIDKQEVSVVRLVKE